MKEIKKLIIVTLMASVALSCVDDRNFDPPAFNCDAALVANASYAVVKDLFVDQTFQIQEDLMIEGYVISSDKAGNFFSVLHFQDRPVHPTEGFQMEIDVRDAHLFYPVGSKIYIKLKGLYLGRSNDVFRIGGVFTSFGNESVGRLPATVVDQHIFVSCEPLVSIQPTLVFMDQLVGGLTNTLVQFSDVEFLEEELGQPFALAREETKRTLTDCNDNEIALVNSGFADFQAEPLPEANGTITGVLLRKNNNFHLTIRALADLAFVKERCEDLVDEFTSMNIFISELADPDNNEGARFVELYNAAAEPLSLKSWRLLRYTNDNTVISSSIDLSGLSIGAENTLVISPNAAEFERVYGFAPDLGVGTNSAADSNGDDNLVLLDPFGTVIDIFGVIGVDGSGTNHEFEDGRAVRNAEVTQGNPTYTFSEWTVYNDTGGSGTIQEVQVAPDDFNPKARN